MTISNNERRVQLVADGTTGPYPFRFRIFSEEEVRVFDGESQKALATDYTVDFDFEDEDAEEGAINFVSGQQPTSGNLITIDSRGDSARSVDLQQSGPPVQVELNEDLDRLWAKVQEIELRLLRTLGLPDFDPLTTADIPINTLRASRAFHFDSAGLPLMVEPTDASGTAVTAAGSTTSRLLAERFGEVFNVKDFGAAWDGVTDDRAAVQAAWDAARAAGRGIVQLPPGVGIIGDRTSGSGFLQCYGSNIWLRGSGRGATTLKRQDDSEAATDDHLILVGEGAANAASNIKISDMTIDGNRGANTNGPQSTHNVRIENATNVLLENLESRNGIYYGLHIIGQDAVTERITVRDCYVHTCGRDCIDVKNQGGFNDDILFGGVIAENPGLQGVANDACFDFRGPFVASNLIARLPGTRHHGIRIRGEDNSSVEGRPALSNIRILAENSHTQDDLLLIEGIEANVSNGLVQNGGANGVQIQGARARLSNIQVRNCDGDGFWLRDATLVGERAKLIGCLATSNGGAGFDIDTDNNIFVACEARSNAGNGFESPAGADRNEFFGCQSSSNTGSDWALSGAANISHTFRQGAHTATLSSGGNMTVTFDSAFPTECLGVVASIEGDPAAGGEVVYVDSITAGSFVARHRSNPGAVSRTIRYWAWGR